MGCLRSTVIRSEGWNATSMLEATRSEMVRSLRDGGPVCFSF